MVNEEQGKPKELGEVKDQVEAKEESKQGVKRDPRCLSLSLNCLSLSLSHSLRD